MDGPPPVCYNAHMKKMLAFALALLLCLGLSACKKDTSAGDHPLDVTDPETPGSSAASLDAAAPGDEAVSAVYGSKAAVTVTGAAAYAFTGTEGPTVYASAAYENTGDCPVIVTSAQFEIKGDVAAFTHEFTPALNEYLVLLPGDTGYLAEWIPREDAVQGASVSLSASLTVAKADDRGVRLGVDHLYIADNYPGFSTLSGRLSCAEGKGCGANMVSVGFYGEAGDFLGAWYFSKNALMEAGEEQCFVVNMQQFPLADLGARTATMKAVAYGFDF